MAAYDVLLVPYDFSSHAKRALAYAIDLGTRLGSRLHLLHVVQTPVFAHAPGMVAPIGVDMLQIRNEAETALGAVVDALARDSIKLEATVVQDLNVASAIDAAARELGADLIVMGTHGRTGLAHAFVGSVAERTLRHAPCPVLTVRGDEEEAEAG